MKLVALSLYLCSGTLKDAATQTSYTAYLLLSQLLVKSAPTSRQFLVSQSLQGVAQIPPYPVI